MSVGAIIAIVIAVLAVVQSRSRCIRILPDKIPDVPVVLMPDMIRFSFEMLPK